MNNHRPYDGAHLQFEKEWWYLNVIANGGDLGFMCSFFRSSTSHDWFGIKLKPKLFVNVAVADRLRQEYLFEEFNLLPLPGWVNYKSRSFKVRLGVSGMKRNADDSISVWGIGRRISYALRLECTRPILQIDGDGRIAISPKFQAGVYSMVDMALSGWILVDRRKIRVHGRGWIDHEWATWDWSFFQGWDWLCAYFDSGDAVCAFRLRDFDGQTLYQRGAIINQEGLFQTLRTRDISLVPTHFWKSPFSKVSYPVSWRVGLSTDAISGDFVILPLLDGQEIHRSRGHFRHYWEGLSEVYGQVNGSPITGHGFLELTGYDRSQP